MSEHIAFVFSPTYGYHKFSAFLVDLGKEKIRLLLLLTTYIYIYT